MKFPDDLVEAVARAILSTRLGAGFDQDYVDESWGKFTDEATAALTALVGWAWKPENVTDEMIAAHQAEHKRFMQGMHINSEPQLTNSRVARSLAAAIRALGEP